MRSNQTNTDKGVEMAKLSYAQAALLLKYDSEVGSLTWRHRSPALFGHGRHGQISTALAWNKQFAGAPALTALDERGYPHGKVAGHNVRSHQVAWLLHHGEWPEIGLDHINGILTDFRIQNLRLADQATNSRNTRKRPNNTSGTCGVRQHPKTGRWVADIGFNRQRIHIGYFATEAEAISARLARQAALGFSARHGT